MIPQELLASAEVPGGGGELKLYRHDRDFYIRVDGTELMSSRVYGSEEMLAERAFECLPELGSARVLVGGLGMGFTLARVLSLVGPGAQVEVVELVPEVVAWNREYFGHLCGAPLDDPRVQLREGDVVPRIRSSRQAYDAILLDVDNGPEGLTCESNGRLYTEQGLHACRRALARGGVLAVWSSSQHPWFTERLRRVGFEAREQRVRARRNKGGFRRIWVAQLL